MNFNSKPFVDHYKVLGIRPLTSTEVEIRKAYKKQALEWHPDKNSSAEAEEVFKKINTANEILSDPKKRIIYEASWCNHMKEKAPPTTTYQKQPDRYSWRFSSFYRKSSKTNHPCNCCCDRCYLSEDSVVSSRIKIFPNSIWKLREYELRSAPGVKADGHAVGYERWKQHGWKFTYFYPNRILSPVVTDTLLQQRWSKAMDIYIVEEGFFPPRWIKEYTTSLWSR